MITEDKILSEYLGAIIWTQGMEVPSAAVVRKMENDFIKRLAEYKDDKENYDTYRFLYSMYGKQVVSRNAFFVRMKDDGSIDPPALALLSSVSRLREALKSLDPQLYKKELGAMVKWARRQHHTMTNTVAQSRDESDAGKACVTDEKPSDIPTIISGVQGLADYLGCSKGTAMKIVKSRVLPNGKVQYKVGENWKFNREKLDKFLADNPEVLGRQKPCNK